MEHERNQSSGERQHYSPEEMMARLKKNERHKHRSDSSQEHQLITREDGTQVVKVRRRKRRTHQPHKQKKKIHAGIRWAILGSVTGITVLLIAGSFYIIAKYNGAAFKKETESKIAALTGAKDVGITQLRVTPASIKAQKIEFLWDQYSHLSSAAFNEIEGDIHVTSFMSSKWNGDEIVSGNADVFLKLPPPSTETSQDSPISPYKFETYRCNQLNLYFGRFKNSPHISEMGATFKMLPDGSAKFACSEGKIIIQGWPELSLSSSVAIIGSTDIELNALLSSGTISGGQIQVKGQIQKDSTKSVHLEVQATNFPIEKLLGNRLGMIFQGPISCDGGSLQYHANKPPEQTLSLVMPFHSSSILMAELPMFDDLRKLTDNIDFSRPDFKTCKAVLKRTNDKVIIEQIDFHSPNLISLKGQIEVHLRTDRHVQCSIEIGPRVGDQQDYTLGYDDRFDGDRPGDLSAGGRPPGCHSPRTRRQGTVHPASRRGCR